MQDNDIEIYSTRNEGKSVAPQRIIRTLKNKIHKYLTSVSKNEYVDKLADIVNLYNNTYHSTINMKPAYVTLITYIDCNKENDNKDSKFEVCDDIRILEYKNIFEKGYV